MTGPDLSAHRARLGDTRRRYCQRLAAMTDGRHKPAPQHLYAWETGRRPVPVWVVLAVCYMVDE